MRGGEKCLEIFCELFPEADLFTLVHVPGRVSATIERHRIITSLLQGLPWSQHLYRYYLPLMPAAIEALDLRAYDMILSSSHCVAKGVIPHPEALHVSYVHTPMRYAWDMWPEYFSGSGLAMRYVVPLILNYLRTWDVTSAQRVDHLCGQLAFRGSPYCQVLSTPGNGHSSAGGYHIFFPRHHAGGVLFDGDGARAV